MRFAAVFKLGLMFRKVEPLGGQTFLDTKPFVAAVGTVLVSVAAGCERDAAGV